MPASTASARTPSSRANCMIAPASRLENIRRLIALSESASAARCVRSSVSACRHERLCLQFLEQALALAFGRLALGDVLDRADEARGVALGALACKRGSAVGLARRIEPSLR